MDKPPSFEDVSPFKELLYEKLDSAILDVRQHFDDSAHRRDVPGFFAKHVRSKLHDLLEPMAESYAFSIDVSTGSFLIYYKDFIIKFRKAYNGMFPPPRRRSKADMYFLNHNSNLIHRPTLPGFEPVSSSQTGVKIHLIACYDLDSNSGFSWLRIACPLKVSATGINCFWDEQVESSLFSKGIQLNGGIQRKDTTKKTPRSDLSFTLKDEKADDPMLGDFDLTDDNDD